MVKFGRKRVVVTGGAGFLGSHLCARLLADGSQVYLTAPAFEETFTPAHVQPQYGATYSAEADRADQRRVSTC